MQKTGSVQTPKNIKKVEDRSKGADKDYKNLLNKATKTRQTSKTPKREPEIKKTLTVNLKRIDELSKPKETDPKLVEKIKKTRTGEKEKAETIAKTVLKITKPVYSRQTSMGTLNNVSFI